MMKLAAVLCGCLLCGCSEHYVVMEKWPRVELRGDQLRVGMKEDALVVIDWLEGAEPEPAGVTELGDGEFEWSVAGTGFKAEVFEVEDGLVGLHARANKPGALGFRLTLEGGEVEPVGRRLLVAGGTLRAWVFPMESDVEADGDGILLRGEGEALVVMAHGEAAHGRLQELGVEGDRTEDVMALLGRLLEAAGR